MENVRTDTISQPHRHNVPRLESKGRNPWLITKGSNLVIDDGWVSRTTIISYVMRTTMDYSFYILFNLLLHCL